jgi:hypothetical protein
VDALITPPLGVAAGDGVVEITVVVGPELCVVDVPLVLVGLLGLVWLEVEVWVGAACALARWV